MKWTKGDFTLYDEREKADADVIHSLLVGTYWAKGRSLETVKKTLAGSLCFSLYEGDRQIGFARAVTDHATYAIILDVVVHERYRGRGLGKWMMECITGHPDLAPLKQVLWTSDADGLYRKSGFFVPDELRFMFRNSESSRGKT
jgi:GNAT superfamily N-acetyltransferase